MSKYALGIDFGTLSGRALLVDVATGEEAALSEFEYPHGVMDEQMTCGVKLPPDWALQHPRDYLKVLEICIPDVIRKIGADPADIIGVGVDFTACSMLPVRADGTPVCFSKEYKSVPNAYVKLWKHHAAQDKANRLNETARERGEKWLARYGGKISSEWMIPKIWQVLDESPDIYEQADKFIEAGDWIVWQLTGNETRNSCAAGYKAIWHKQDGYPSPEFYEALDPRLRNVATEKLGPVSPLGTRAGGITPGMAAMTGLKPGTSVAVANVDAHVCVPAVKIDGPGKMLAIMGTSTCHMILGEEEKSVPGICGYVEDGILPGTFGYEAGQSCVGDHFAWLADNCVPEEYFKIAKSGGMDIHEYLQKLADGLAPGESGLLALDWWNGNRSVLVDVDLTGLMIGMTLKTKPHEMYRALVEATAFGTRMIIETFEKGGIYVDELYAAGGIAEKSPFMMQIYADIIKKPIRISGSAQGPALGAAIFGAVAAGSDRGGYASVFEAARAMGKLKDLTYAPDMQNAKVYDLLYAEYEQLHDAFGRGENDVMKRLKAIRKGVGNDA
jgi:L-ribulokinase